MKLFEQILGKERKQGIFCSTRNANIKYKMTKNIHNLSTKCIIYNSILILEGKLSTIVCFYGNPEKNYFK